MSSKVIAIDGPAGAGKSSVAARVAGELDLLLLDTGALYRAVALVGGEQGISVDDGPALGALAERLELRFERVEGGKPRLTVDGVDRSTEIRRPEVSDAASRVSAHPEVRAALLGVQRTIGAEQGLVVEGRDIGTVVFPDAPVKIFLTASVDARAGRRHRELVERGEPVSLEAVRAEIERRDERDTQRAVAPLRCADDAIEVDTSEMSFEGVVEHVVSIARSRASWVRI